MLPKSAYSCAGSWAVPCVFLVHLDVRCTGRAEQVHKSAAAYCIQLLSVVDGKLGIISSADAGLEAVASRPTAMAVNASGPRCPNHEGRRVQPVSCIQISTSCARHRSIFVPGMYILGGTAVGFRRRFRLIVWALLPNNTASSSISRYVVIRLLYKGSPKSGRGVDFSEPMCSESFYARLYCVCRNDVVSRTGWANCFC